MTAIALHDVGAAPSRLAGAWETDDQASSLRRLVEALGVASAQPQPAADRNGKPLEPVALQRIARTVAIASGKGGVGKTTLCVNLCVALARAGLRITLVDGDLGLANADVLCGLPVRAHIGDVVAGLRRIEDICLDAPGGFRLIPGAAGVASLADLDSRAVAGFVNLLHGASVSSDAMALDCGAGIGRGVMALLGAADLPIIVATPEPTSITDAYALIKCHVQAGRMRGAPMTPPQLVINRARDAKEAYAAHQRIDAVSQRFLGQGVALLGWVPRDDAVERSVRSRNPTLITDPGAPASRAIVALAQSVRTQLGIGASNPASERLGAERGPLHRLARFVRRAGAK